MEKEDVTCYEDRVLVKYGEKYLCGYEDIWPVSGSCQLAQQLTDDKTIVGRFGSYHVFGIFGNNNNS